MSSMPGVSAARVGVLLALVIVAIVIAPLLIAAAGSVWSAPFIRLPGTLTLDNYITFLSDPNTASLMLTTLQMPRSWRWLWAAHWRGSLYAPTSRCDRSCGG